VTKALSQRSIGAVVSSEGVQFRVWAPAASRVEVVWEKSPLAAWELSKGSDGFFTGTSREMEAGALYRFRVDGKGPFPDPASRRQPQGVHGPSEVVDSRRFSWKDAAWKGIPADKRIFYELHVGTFTPEGTFAAAARRLRYLAKLGVTVIELLPVAEFPGERNWGYDGVFPFAPARCYGTPDELRRFVQDAHDAGLAVVMDVVYNHLGPDGNYTGVFSPHYLTSRHRSPWGDGINFDGKNSRPVRDFFIENALHWIDDYHIDGLRLDATHAIIDDSADHFLSELARRVHASRPSNPPFLIAEDHRNLASLLQPPTQKGFALDGVWSDDFHHVARCFLAGDHESYYQDYRPDLSDLAKTIQQGWLYTGEMSKHMGHPRGSDPAGLPYDRFVTFIQNHDQVGNRAFGERLNAQIEPAAYRALSALWLCTPETPLLFMGQEWAASSPFLFFTDHSSELGAKVTEGRRREFKTFTAFNDPKSRDRIPDPQALETFTKSRLHWDEAESDDHRGCLLLYKALLHRRRQEPALRDVRRAALSVEAVGDETIVLHRDGEEPIVVVARLRGNGPVDLAKISWAKKFEANAWERLLSTEDRDFSPEAKPIEGDVRTSAIRFQRPGAVLWKGKRP
jgi:maltooligosyltrehalose trehalohydrolase